MGGGARPFLFGDVICLVDYFNDRDLSLLNSVQHDSSLTSFTKTLCVERKVVQGKNGCATTFYLVCEAMVASFKTDSVWFHCVDCKYNFALDSQCADFPQKCVFFFVLPRPSLFRRIFA